MIVTVTLNPSVDHALLVPEIKVGDTNRVLKMERDAGGKGLNLSRIVNRLGGDTLATGLIGGGAGAYVSHRLGVEGVPHDFVQLVEETRHNFSVETADGGPPTTFNEPGPNVTQAEFEHLVSRLEVHLATANWLSLGGSCPPGLNSSSTGRLIKLGIDSGVKVALDADGDLLKEGISAGVSFVKPNLKEAQRLLEVQLTTDEAILSAVRKIHDQMRPSKGNGIAVISLGEVGAVMATANGVYRGTCACEPSDSTVGCGDSMVGGMLWALERGLPDEEVFVWGLAAGAATATSDGSDIGTLEQIQRCKPNAKVSQI